MKNIKSDGSLKIIEIDEAEYKVIMDKMTTISALRSNMNIQNHNYARHILLVFNLSKELFFDFSFVWKMITQKRT